MESGGNIFGSAHQDVLGAPIPVDRMGRTILTNELKNRAKGAVQAQQWPDAAALYRKAVQIVEAQLNDDKASSSSFQNDLAILESNLSLVHGKMHQWDAALVAAQRAVEVDPTYVKGWWRLSQAQAAHDEYDAAIKAMKEGLKREPTNKAFQKELEKLKSEASAAAIRKEKERAARAAAETPKTEPAPARSELPQARSSAVAAPSTSTTSTTTEKMQIDDHGEEFSKSEVVRGYKVINGKKTSYFHNELSKEAAELIGDIAPKKIEDPAVVVGTAPSGGGATSAWNQAGTWEEKDVSAWGQETLQKSLLEASYTLPPSSPAPSAVAKLTKATIDGHASVAVARGKKRYIYEWLVKLEWNFTHNDITAKGKIDFPDVDGTCIVGEPYEAHGFAVQECEDANLTPILEQFVHRQGLRDEIHKAIDDWVRLFKETY